MKRVHAVAARSSRGVTDASLSHAGTLVCTKTRKQTSVAREDVLRLSTRSLQASAYTGKLRATDTAGSRQRGQMRSRETRQ